MEGRRLSAAELALEAPAYLAAAVLLVVGVIKLIASMTPGVNQEDTRPMVRLSDGLAALFLGVVLVSLGYFAAKRPALASSLAITASFALALALFMLLAVAKGDRPALYLILAAPFTYACTVAIVRIARLRRQRASSRRS
jgi:peptidoglycan/LPS O-acetylase OafA/YrhL